MPVLLVLLIKKEENTLWDFKECLKFVVISAIIWGAGYVSMWFTKWILAGIILNINPIPYVKDNALQRINGLQGLKSKKTMYIGAIYNNWHSLYPINIIKRVSTLRNYFVATIVSVLVLIDWKNIKRKWFAGLLIMIAVTPYVRYLILANHSYRHAIFTFRTQIISCMAIMYAILEVLNYKILFKEIKFKKRI